MKDAQARTIYLKDYQPPDFLVDKTELYFDLYEDHALVKARLEVRPNLEILASKDLTNLSLVLNGQELVLEYLAVADQKLSSDQYLVDSETLTIPAIGSFLGEGRGSFILECHTRITPQLNTALEGLYKSGPMFCTQCEAEGFRRITYYPDRPDVMSVYTTTIAAEQNTYPVLLSNGNQVGAGQVDGQPQRHWVTWHDPFPKPSYLFALVAGKLAHVEDKFVTQSGRDVTIKLFVEDKDLDKCDHAINSLKNAMRWDEEVYGREYDLDIFMIVAVDTFNMGAMENKGLNIFNTSCVLANPKTTTDAAFQRVEAVVAHEYFHNWSGNRVTCRDWFQLSLKEGFTVFRDSEFSADMGSRTVKRVEDVALLRTAQFAEDAGPMAHPVRPDAYMEISNFYTLTVYEKGAEVVRMISQLLGHENFRKGTDLYFERHDGQAVTTEDFVKAMEEVSGIDLQQFRNWYSQAGTPELEIISVYDSELLTYTLHITQSCLPSPGQAQKNPFHIPLRIGLLDPEGHEIKLQLKGEDGNSATCERVLDIKSEAQKFVFVNVDAEPVPSLLRGFSAPVKLHYSYEPQKLWFLMVNDTDGFNRWDASQRLSTIFMEELIEQGDSANITVPEMLIEAFEQLLNSSLSGSQVDKAMLAQVLTLPAEGMLIEGAECADVESIHRVRQAFVQGLGSKLKDLFTRVYQQNSEPEKYSISAEAVARRSLKNLCLHYLMQGGDEFVDICESQFSSAANMTDQNAALRCLVQSPYGEQSMKNIALARFYEQWQHEPLVVDQWFSVQASCSLPGTLERVKTLCGHADFNIKNPNKVRALIGAFCGQNHVNFHVASGAGYEFLADKILLLNSINPQIASRLLAPLTRWKKFDPLRQKLMQQQLVRIRASADLSKDVFEVVEKSLADVNHV